MALAILILAVASLLCTIGVVMGKLECKVALLLLSVTVLIMAVGGYAH